MRAIAIAIAAIAAALLIPASPASASAGSEAPLARPQTANEVVVRFHGGASASMRAAARRSVGASAARRLLLDNTQVLRVKPGTARAASRALERLDAVSWAEPNMPVQGGAATTDDPDFGELWGLSNTGQTVDGRAGVPGVDVNALPAWDTTRGAGAVIAIVDSGVAADHPDMQGNLWTNSGETPGNGVDDDDNGLVDDVRGWDFWDWDNDPDDFHSHGTHVAGTAAATGDNQTGIVGVAPEARVMPVRVLNNSNRGRTADLANGIAYAALNGADVINTSIGTPPEPDFPLPEVDRDALDLAAANDAVVVVAAMNDSKDNDTGHTPTWPCNFTHPNLICVAALDSDGGLSDFSNYGAASVDVGAPGRSILSLAPDWDRLTPPGVEGFESDIVGRWYGNGSWARTTAFAASPAFSLTDSPAGNYANDTTPWAAMTNGVDLTGQRGCRINYAIRGRVLDGDLFVTGPVGHRPRGAGRERRHARRVRDLVRRHLGARWRSRRSRRLRADHRRQRNRRRRLRRRLPLHLPSLELQRGQLLLQRGHLDGHATRLRCRGAGPGGGPVGLGRPGRGGDPRGRGTALLARREDRHGRVGGRAGGDRGSAAPDTARAGPRARSARQPGQPGRFRRPHPAACSHRPGVGARAVPADAPLVPERGPGRDRHRRGREAPARCGPLPDASPQGGGGEGQAAAERSPRACEPRPCEGSGHDPRARRHGELVGGEEQDQAARALSPRRMAAAEETLSEAHRPGHEV